ncbi:inorganic phosphate transporter Pho88 [Sphaerosporella brunnea]|uniref:Inorganic phosphate transporter Pho88 n=1 Tax=Sphaerosporella brunnea TaxID=1250544 RepID=A0A5J5EB79_9PEZI|nr:inorganic phosphate transporter Pho88 [Sphaerosporella brunnea]
MLGMMQVSKRIPFEDPNWLNGIRALYALSNIIVVSLYLFVGKKIKSKNDQTTLKYVEPAPAMSGEEPKLVTTTVAEYYESQLKAAFKSVLMGVGMMGVMHVYFQYTNPLLIQSIIPVKGALESKLVQVHVFGKPATGDLKRPWKTASFMQGMQGGDAKSDKESIEEAEKSGRGGVKEE